MVSDDDLNEILQRLRPGVSLDGVSRSWAVQMWSDCSALLNMLTREREEHAAIQCSECGTEACQSMMHDVESGVWAHSEDISYRQVCPYCWMRPTSGE